MLEVTKISIKGQVTIPIEFRRKLGLTEGSKVAFVDGEDGRVYIVNSSTLALRKVQSDFKGEAERLGITSDEDILTLLKDERK